MLASGIEDSKGNTTRFLLIARKSDPSAQVPEAQPASASGPPAIAPPGVQWRTSMVFAPKHNVPGALFKALSVFSLRDIDLTKLESRPATPGVHYDPTSLRRFAQPSGQASPPASPPLAPMGGAGSSSVGASPSGLPAAEEGSLIEYMFFLDVAAHRAELRMLKAVDHLGEIASFVRVLGSYAASESKGATRVARSAVDAILASKSQQASDGSDASAPDAAAAAVPASGAGGDSIAPSASAAERKPDADAGTAPARSHGAAKLLSEYTIGIIGFGVFGQFLAKGFLEHARQSGKRLSVVATSRGDYTQQAEAIGAKFALGMREFFSHSPDIVIFATSILSFASVLRRIPESALAGKLVMDVLSVKQHPKELLLDLQNVPPSADILLTHPMFGPESGKHGWDGLPMVYETARVDSSPAALARLEFALDLFRDQGCSMVSMSAERHDELAAGTQFVTHLTGRVLHRLRLAPCEIATKGFEALLQLVDNTCKDSFDLFLALYRHNKSSRRQLDALAVALEEIRTELTADEDSAQGGSSSQAAASGSVSVPASGGGAHQNGNSAAQDLQPEQPADFPCSVALRYEALNPTVGAVEPPITTVLHA